MEKTSILPFLFFNSSILSFFHSSILNPKVLSVVIIDETTGFMTVKAGWSYDEIRHIKGKETVAIETARIALRQHKGLADMPLGIDMTEIGSCEETVIAT